MVGKTMNAGQICLAPDYLLVPEEKLDEVIDAAQQGAGEVPLRIDPVHHRREVDSRSDCIGRKLEWGKLDRYIG